MFVSNDPSLTQILIYNQTGVLDRVVDISSLNIPYGHVIPQQSYNYFQKDGFYYMAMRFNNIFKIAMFDSQFELIHQYNFPEISVAVSPDGINIINDKVILKSATSNTNWEYFWLKDL